VLAESPVPRGRSMVTVGELDRRTLGLWVPSPRSSSTPHRRWIELINPASRAKGADPGRTVARRLASRWSTAWPARVASTIDERVTTSNVESGRPGRAGRSIDGNLRRRLRARTSGIGAPGRTGGSSPSTRAICRRGDEVGPGSPITSSGPARSPWRRPEGVRAVLGIDVSSLGAGPS